MKNLFEKLKLCYCEYETLEKLLEVLYLVEDEQGYESKGISYLINDLQDFLYKKGE